MPNYTKEQLQGLYKNLPEDLKKATFSDEVAQNIQDICNSNGIVEKEIIFEVAKNIGYVFLGLLPPDEFPYVLEKDLKIEKNKAEEIAAEITLFIFLPVKTSLEALYGVAIKPTSKPKPKATATTKKTPKKKDVYREPLG